MEFFFKKQLRIAIAMFLALALTFTHASYAEDNSINLTDGELLLVTGGILAVGVIPALIALLIKRSTTPPIVPITPYGGPVILSTSNHNLLSYNVAAATPGTTTGAAVSGTITVQNNGDVPRQFTVASNITPLVVTNSTCSVSVAAGETCTFSITYPTHTLTTPTPVINSINFKVVDGNGISDAITINTVDMTTADPATSDFFDPSIYDTNARGLPYAANNIVTLAKNNYNFLYASLNNNNYSDSSSTGIFRSTDGGVTWSPVNNELMVNAHTLGFTSMCLMHSTLFISTYGNNGAFFSTNGGESWQPVTGLSSYTINVLYCSSNNILYAGTTGGILQSTDGINWIEIDAGVLSGAEIVALCSVPNPNNSSSDVLCVTDKLGNFYIGTVNGTTWSWTKISSPFGGSNGTPLYATGNYVYAGVDSGIYFSIDRGQTWNPSTINGSGKNYLITSFCSFAGSLYAGTAKGTAATTNGTGVLISTDNGNSWNQFNTGIPTLNINIYTLYPTGNLLYAGTDIGILAAAARGNGWSTVSSMLTMQTVRSLYAIKTNLYAGLFSGFGVFVSTDGGANWVVTNNGLTNTYVNALYFDPISNKLYAGTNGIPNSVGVFAGTVGTGGSISWAPTTLTNQNIIALYSSVYSGDSKNYLYAGAGAVDAAGTPPAFGLSVSPDGGTSWSSSGDITGQQVVDFSSDGNGNVYAGTYTGNAGLKGNVFSSNDAGYTWPSVGFLDQDVFALYFRNSTSNLYAGTNLGMFLTDIISSNWQSDATWTYSNVFDICAISTMLYASSANTKTNFGGVYYMDTTATTPSWLPTSFVNGWWYGYSAYILYALYNGINNNLYVGTVLGVIKSVQP